MPTRIPPPPPAVADTYAGYPPAIRKRLLALRKLILTTAAETEGVGPIEEALRWGEPSFLTTKSRSGSTVRINRVKGRYDRYDRYAAFLTCSTNLVETYRQMFPNLFDYSGNSAIEFDVAADLDDAQQAALAHCIAMALTYRLRTSSR